jgi:hypothetical protein
LGLLAAAAAGEWVTNSHQASAPFLRRTASLLGDFSPCVQVRATIDFKTSGSGLF